MQRVVHTSTDCGFCLRGFLGLQSGSDKANSLHSFQRADSTCGKGNSQRETSKPQPLPGPNSLQPDSPTPTQKGEARLGSAVGGVAPPRLFQGGSFPTRQQKQALRRRGIICYYYWR